VCSSLCWSLFVRVGDARGELGGAEGVAEKVRRLLGLPDSKMGSNSELYWRFSRARFDDSLDSAVRRCCNWQCS
jgi:hypothetical protein